MAQRGGVAVVQHGCQRGAFTGAGRTYHQQQAAFFHDQLRQDGRHVQAPKRGDLSGYVADHGRVGAALAKAADAEIAHPGKGQAHVQLAHLLELFNTLGRQHFGQQVERCFRRQHLAVDGQRLAVDLDQGRRVRRQVDV
ncbi:hypothetical protein D9M73_141540 [compost metagenome]